VTAGLREEVATLWTVPLRVYVNLGDVGEAVASSALFLRDAARTVEFLPEKKGLLWGKISVTRDAAIYRLVFEFRIGRFAIRHCLSPLPECG
jgi:hypothetical protein